MERRVFDESLQITVGWALDVTEIMLSLMGGSNVPLPDYAKKPIGTFTGKIGQDHLLLRGLMYCVSYQKLLTHNKHDMNSPSERVGARVTEEKSATANDIDFK